MDSERLRVWCEDMSPADLRRSDVVRALAQHRLAPLIAARAEHLGAALADAIRALTDAGIQVGLWPLLSDEAGYWANANNIDALAAHVEATARFVLDNGLTVTTFAIDVEPPLDALRALQRARGVDRLRALVAPQRSKGARPVSSAAAAGFTRIQSYLEFHGFNTLAAGIPLVILDHGAPTALLQNALATPLLETPWDRISWMTYTTIASGYFRPLISRADARALMTLMLERALAFDRRRTAVSIGLTSTGRMRDEEVYRSPVELARDVAAVRALGISDIAVYSLEGILARPESERWFEALGAPLERAPITLKARVLFESAWLATRAASVIAPSL